jgi:carboxylesterase
MTIWLLVSISVLIGGGLNRRRVRRKFEGEYVRRFQPTASGIASGAESFKLLGTNRCALLLLHGSGDSPQSLRYLGDRLHSAGYTVYAPLLPGHGRSPGDFAQATAADYHDATNQALDELRNSHARIGIVGLSMGGALAVRAASETPDVRILVLLAPYLIPPISVRWTCCLGWLWSWAIPYMRGRGEASVHDVDARAASRAYGSFSIGALSALVATARAGRRVLSTLTMPMLVINSEHDNRIPRQLAEKALSEMPDDIVQHWVTDCGHVITVDFCKATVAELVLTFLAHHAG